MALLLKTDYIAWHYQLEILTVYQEFSKITHIFHSTSAISIQFSPTLASWLPHHYIFLKKNLSFLSK